MQAPKGIEIGLCLLQLAGANEGFQAVHEWQNCRALCQSVCIARGSFGGVARHEIEAAPVVGKLGCAPWGQGALGVERVV